MDDENKVKQTMKLEVRGTVQKEDQESPKLKMNTNDLRQLLVMSITPIKIVLYIRKTNNR